MREVITTQTTVADPLIVRKGITKYKGEFPERFINGQFPARYHDESEKDYELRKKRTRGAMNGNFTKILKKYIKKYADERAVDLSPKIDLYRRLIFSWVLTPDDEIFSERSTSEYQDADWFAISRWQGSHKDQNGSWVLRDAFEGEVLQVLHCAKEDWKDVQLGQMITFNDIQVNWEKILKDKNHFGQEEFSGYVQKRFDEATPRRSGLFVPEPTIKAETENELCDQCHQFYNPELAVCPFCFP